MRSCIASTLHSTEYPALRLREGCYKSWSLASWARSNLAGQMPRSCQYWRESHGPILTSCPKLNLRLVDFAWACKPVLNVARFGLMRQATQNPKTMLSPAQPIGHGPRQKDPPLGRRRHLAASRLAPGEWTMAIRSWPTPTMAQRALNHPLFGGAAISSCVDGTARTIQYSRHQRRAFNFET